MIHENWRFRPWYRTLRQEIDAGTIAVNARPVPLADVEAAWTAPELPGQRTVLIP